MYFRNPSRARGSPLPCLLLVSLVASIGSLRATAAENGLVLVLGDSISAAYGMSPEQGWVKLLERRLAEEYPGHEVLNASISGETSAGGVSRLPRLLERHRPSLVIIELGGNDGLRGHPIGRLRENLETMIELSRASGAATLLLGMEIPPNYGSRYTRRFRESFQLVAERTGSALLPFMLDGVATERSLMQADGIHPKPEAQTILLDNVWPSLEPLLAP